MNERLSPSPSDLRHHVCRFCGTPIDVAPRSRVFAIQFFVLAQSIEIAKLICFLNIQTYTAPNLQLNKPIPSDYHSLPQLTSRLLSLALKALSKLTAIGHSTQDPCPLWSMRIRVYAIDCRILACLAAPPVGVADKE